MPVPRWGIHDGIKYSRRRCTLKVCPICGKLFVQYNRGKRLYCSEVCSANARKKKMQAVNRKIILKRDKQQHSMDESIAYAQKLRRGKAWRVGSTNALQPPKKEDGTKDWDTYHRILKAEHNKVRL
jgi:hypothetical protein